MWRAGFGPAASQLAQLQTLAPSQLYKALQKASANSPASLDATDDYLKGLFKGIQEEGVRQMLDKEERRNIQQQTKQAVKGLNLLWLDEMVNANAQLREKMAFFWHGHFASRNLNVFYQQQLLDVIRQNALGSFRDLLHGVSKSAAMLNFLNAQQNRKGHPNENFAREVMELFTLGRGNYTENDIKEAARAFTGWGANLQGDFVFRKFQHDTGTKTVLGHTGNFVGENILDILLQQKQAARFITQKIYRFFVNDSVDQAKVDWLAERFFQHDYNIGGLMEDIFTSDWFYEEKNIGAKIKSPIELIAGIRRMLPMEIENADAQLLVQRLLGQMLFYPPNVAGWPGGKTWIDSSTLMFRLRLPQLISDNDELNVRPKSDDDQMMGRMDEGNAMVSSKKAVGKIGRPIRAVVDWSTYVKNFDSTPKEKLVDVMNGSLLQVTPAFGSNLIQQYADSSSREAFVKSATLQIMSTPEYQLC
ncbi:DUF1800 domain-containing protein [Flavisolibacter nicotianae]|uniref:DUF1800 domain-containing protein n=1 Tax=Flavisolibacter nicotianae TaxID=2364882 RepID=UPI001F09F87B|nr:DUF1800 domain-containing protein [Flavisolibacter nicotianae]